MAEGNLNIIRDDSCWLEHNESDGQILLNDICGPKRSRTIVRRTLWLLFSIRLRMPLNVTAQDTRDGKSSVGPCHHLENPTPKEGLMASPRRRDMDSCLARKSLPWNACYIVLNMEMFLLEIIEDLGSRKVWHLASGRLL